MTDEKPPGEECDGAQQEDQSSNRKEAGIHNQMETGATVSVEDGNNQENSKTDDGKELVYEEIQENNEQQLPSGGENVKDNGNNQPTTTLTDKTPLSEMKELDSQDDYMVQGEDQNQVHTRELRQGGSALDNEKPVDSVDGDKPLKNIVEGHVKMGKDDQEPSWGTVGAEEQQQQQQHVGVKADQEQQQQQQADVKTDGKQGDQQQQQPVDVKEGEQLQQQQQVGVETDREQGEKQQQEQVNVTADGEVAEQQQQVNIKADGELMEENERQQQEQVIVKTEDQRTEEHQTDIQDSTGNEESHVESRQEQPDQITSQQNEDGTPLQTQEGHSGEETPVNIQEISDRQYKSSDATKEKEGETVGPGVVDLPKFEKQVKKAEENQVSNQTEGSAQSEATAVSVKPGLLQAGSMVDNQAAVRHPDEMREENRKLKQEIFVSKQQADAFRVRVLTLEQEVGKLRARKIDNRSQDSLASDSDSYLKQKLGETERELDTAERKVKDLQLRLKRFAKDDQIKDEKIVQMERELKELSDSNMKLEQSLESKTEANNNTATTQYDKNDSKVCVIL